MECSGFALCIFDVVNTFNFLKLIYNSSIIGQLKLLHNLLKDLSKQEENEYLADIAGLGEDAVSEYADRTFSSERETDCLIFLHF